jgi:surfactin synthase thioesterase subunit
MIPRMTMAGCNITDIEGTLQRITSQDMWPIEWGKTAEKYLKLAQKAESRGHTHTAYEMYFHAMIYYYEGQKVLFEESERKVELYKNVMDIYDKVIEFCPYEIEKVEIPFNGENLPAFLHKPAGDGPYPCLLFIQGMDSSKEEWHRWGRYAVERGFSLLCVDTPGHGETRHLYNKTCLEIPKVKQAASVCREFLKSREDILNNKIGILGNCLGSNYAFQTAAHDKEFACCLIILTIAEFRVRESVGDNVPKWFTDMIRFFTCDTTGQPGMFEKYIEDFRLDKLEDNVTCPVHLFHPEEDNWLDWEQVDVMGKHVEGPLEITQVKGAPVFEGNVMSHLVPIYEQIHWVLPVAFDWVAEQLKD